jgi:hypothetical protein
MLQSQLPVGGGAVAGKVALLAEQFDGKTFSEHQAPDARPRHAGIRPATAPSPGMARWAVQDRQGDQKHLGETRADLNHLINSVYLKPPYVSPLSQYGVRAGAMAQPSVNIATRRHLGSPCSGARSA